MQALRKTLPEPGIVYNIDTPLPATKQQDVLIRVQAAGICGSDLHAYQWSSGYEFMSAHMPLTLGHEFAGVAENVPQEQARIAAGSKVTIWPTITCNQCDACKNHQPEYCCARTIIGLHRDGGFSDYVSVPYENCFPLPDEMPVDLGALTEPVSIAIHAVKTAEIRQSDHLVVFGPGPIGLFTALYAQSLGVKVALVGYQDEGRLDLARQMGIALSCDSAQMDLSVYLDSCFGGCVERVIEAAGSVTCLEQGAAILAPGGVMVVAGIHSEAFSLNVTPFVRRKQQLRGAHDTTRDSFEEAIRFINDHQEIFQLALTHTFPLSEGKAAFATALEKQAMKVLLKP